MSPSNRLAIFIPVGNTDESTVSDKGKGADDAAHDGSPTLSANKRYLIRFTELLNEKATLELALKDESNTALLTAVELRRENCYLRAKNHELKKEATEAFESSKEALSEVIDTFTCAVLAFEMLVEADDVPWYERRLDFQESLHKATLAGEEFPIFQESSDNEEEEEAPI